MNPNDLFNMMNDIESTHEPTGTILRPPFGWPGGKQKCVEQIKKHLPYRNTYVEPFAGSAAVLLSRSKSRLEVLNDRYSGISCFYRCLRDKPEELIDRLSMSINSKEEFYYCKQTWENCEDPVERAARWYYMLSYSFGSMGRHWLRNFNAHAGKLLNRLPSFREIHERLKDVQIDNCDWYDCLIDYDSKDTVFYIDPPYLDTPTGTYKHNMSKQDHVNLLNTIHGLDGFVAISGHGDPLYEQYEWDDRIEFVKQYSIGGMTDKDGYERDLNQRPKDKEVLWIKT